MYKTVQQWLETIQDSYVREKALTYADPERLENGVYSAVQALSCAFEWEESPEGRDYWYATCKEISIAENKAKEDHRVRTTDYDSPHQKSMIKFMAVDAIETFKTLS